MWGSSLLPPSCLLLLYSHLFTLCPSLSFSLSLSLISIFFPLSLSLRVCVLGSHQLFSRDDCMALYPETQLWPFIQRLSSCPLCLFSLRQLSAIASGAAAEFHVVGKFYRWALNRIDTCKLHAMQEVAVCESSVKCASELATYAVRITCCLCPALLHHVCLCMLLCIKDLKDFMRQAGDITYADAHKQRVGEG